MPEKTEYASGTPAWVDLSTTDPGKAKAFYAEVFGWDYRDDGLERGSSTALVDGRAVAGIRQQPPDAPAGWNTNVAVDDVDDVFAMAIDAGASPNIEPSDVADTGRFAAFSDPQGARVLLWQSEAFPGAELVNEPGAFIWNELICSDCAGASEFYGEVFGWQSQVTPSPDGSEAMMFTGADGPVGSARDPKSNQIPPTWLVYFACDDADECSRAITAAGGAIAIPPIDADFGRMGAAVDATGAAFAFIATNPNYGSTA